MPIHDTIDADRAAMLADIQAKADLFVGGSLQDTDRMFQTPPTPIKSVEFDGERLTVTGMSYDCMSDMRCAIGLWREGDWYCVTGQAGAGFRFCTR